MEAALMTTPNDGIPNHTVDCAVNDGIPNHNVDYVNHIRLPIKLDPSSPLFADEELCETYKYRLPRAHIHDDYIWPGLLISPERLEVMKDFRFRKSDIIIASYPKSGTTWVSELVSLIVNNGDVEKVSTRQLHERVPWLELDAGNVWVRFFWIWQTMCKLIGIRPSEPQNAQISSEPKSPTEDAMLSFDKDHPNKDQVNDEDDDAESNCPRVFFTHLPLEMMPRNAFKKGCKIIYVSRNPKDVAVSFYHFHQMARYLGQQTTTWDEYLALYASGKIYSGSWFEHVLGFWDYSKLSNNVLFLQYEYLKENLPDAVNNISSFLDIEMNSDAVDATVKHCTFQSMKDNKMTNRTGVWLFNHKVSNFMRKGVVGDWKNYFTVAQSQLFDELYESMLGNSGLKFKFEL